MNLIHMDFGFWAKSLFGFRMTKEKNADTNSHYNFVNNIITWSNLDFQHKLSSQAKSLKKKKRKVWINDLEILPRI